MPKNPSIRVFFGKKNDRGPIFIKKKILFLERTEIFPTRMVSAFSDKKKCVPQLVEGTYKRPKKALFSPFLATMRKFFL
jgi:hypothetical protein